VPDVAGAPVTPGGKGTPEFEMGTRKLKRLKQRPLERQWAVSVAGLRAGGAILRNDAANWWMNKEQRSKHRKKIMAKEAQRFADEIGKLKGSYVKIGQVLALVGENLLPGELTNALHSLEYQTLPMAWSAIAPTLSEQLGDKLAELEIETDALAAASLGQVHLARIKKSGEQICLKIQYPQIQETIDSDFRHFIRILKLSRWFKPSKDLDELLQEVHSLLLEEIDYRLEARKTRKMRRLLADDDRYRVPQVISRFSTNKVLALEYMAGAEVTAPEVQNLSLSRRNRIAEAMLDLFLREIFQWGVLQTDPNFGNYRIFKDNQSDRLVLLDFGAVRTLRSGLINPLRATIASAHRQDQQGIINGLIRLKCVHTDQPPEVHALIAQFCMDLLEPMRESFADVPGKAINRSGHYRWKHSGLIKRVSARAVKSAITPHFRLPPKDFTLITRKLAGVFIFIGALNAEFNGYAILEKFVSEWEKDLGN
jgi:predicted unusual protein kinase regulating ubiquinone biosynthesis (AarF/ABC1/UbiB family)